MATPPLAVSGVPNAQGAEKKHKWLWGQNVDKVTTSPLPSLGSSTLGAGE